MLEMEEVGRGQDEEERGGGCWFSCFTIGTLFNV